MFFLIFCIIHNEQMFVNIFFEHLFDYFSIVCYNAINNKKTGIISKGTYNIYVKGKLFIWNMVR